MNKSSEKHMLHEQTQFELDVNHLKSVPHFNEAEYCADEVFTRFPKRA